MENGNLSDKFATASGHKVELTLQPGGHYTGYFYSKSGIKTWHGIWSKEGKSSINQKYDLIQIKK